MAKRILLVDDESAVLFAYKKVLQREQFKVDAIDSKDGSYALLERNSYDVAILDLRLGGESSEEGFELLRHIKDEHPETVIIMITAHGNQEVRDRAYQLGADHYFEKPVSTSRIREALAVSGVMPADRAISNGALEAPAPKVIEK
ncbi:MAG: response regulator [Candidatus Glassbacteria bacterium]|nr:response regulator [Candidatus Glassbacteria bacterium]